MISTVTTTTVSTITTLSLVGSFTLISVLVLLALLVQKELASGSNSVWGRRLQRVVNVGIVPLLMVFVLSTIVKVVEVLH
jgi:hypothetical protein